MEAHTATVGGSRPGHPKETQITSNSTAPDQATASVSEPKLVSALQDLEAPGNIASAWFNLPWRVGASVTARIDTQSIHSMINSTVVNELGLKTHAVRSPINLEGFGGGEEAPKEWALVRAACPIIGLEPVNIPAYVVRSKVVPGLLIGTKIIDEHDVLEKIVKAKAKHGALHPDMNLDPILDAWVAVVDSVQGGDDEKKDEKIKKEQADNAEDEKKDEVKKADQGHSSTNSEVGSTSSFHNARPVSPSQTPLPISSPPTAMLPSPRDISGSTTPRATFPSEHGSSPPAGPIPHSDSGYGSPSSPHQNSIPPQGDSSPLPRLTRPLARPVHPFRPIPPSSPGSRPSFQSGTPSRMESHSPPAASGTGNGKEKEK